MLTIIWAFSQIFCPGGGFEIFWELLKYDTEPWSEQMLLGKWPQWGCSTRGYHKHSICEKCNIWEAQSNKVCLYKELSHIIMEAEKLKMCMEGPVPVWRLPGRKR